MRSHRKKERIYDYIIQKVAIKYFFQNDFCMILFNVFSVKVFMPLIIRFVKSDSKNLIL